MTGKNLCWVLSALVFVSSGLCLMNHHSHAETVSPVPGGHSNHADHHHAPTQDEPRREVSCCLELQGVTEKQYFSRILEQFDSESIQLPDRSIVPPAVAENGQEAHPPALDFGVSFKPSLFCRFLRSHPVNAPPVG